MPFGASVHRPMSLSGLWLPTAVLYHVQMPLLPEMPAGKIGPKALSVATCVTIAGTSFIVYWIVGFFGAADFGLAAVPLGNYLSNDLGQGTAQGVLNLLYIIAMIPSIPPFEYCTRHAVDSFLTSFLKPEFVYKTYRWRQIILATLVYATTLGLAEIFPTETTAVVQVTSAFGVLGVSYFVPVINHFLLLFGWAGVQRDRNWMRNAPISVDRLMGMTLQQVRNSAAVTGPDSDDELDPKATAVPAATGLDDSSHNRSAAKYDAPMNVKGAIKGGALDYEYRKKNLLHPWVLFNDFFLPIFILAFGFWTSVETLKLVFTGQV